MHDRYDFNLEPLEPRVLLSVTLNAANLTIVGSSANDQITIKPGPDQGSIIVSGDPDGDDGTYNGVDTLAVDALAGNDKIRVKGKPTDTNGNPLPVTFIGGPGNDKLIGGPGDDTLIGGGGNDTIKGRGGNDTLEGGDDNDNIKGGKGDDMITGGQGNDRLNGNRGNDTVSFQSAPAGVDVSLADRRANDDGHGTADPKIKKIENVIGSEHDDTLQGNKKKNTIDGRRGTNNLIPGTPADILLQTGLNNADQSRAIWAWEPDTFQLLDDPTHRAETLDLLADNGVTTLYIYADQFNTRTPIADEPNLYHDLLTDIHARGMTAHALLGSQFLNTGAYILPENRDDAYDMFQRVIDYNSAATPDQQFDGIHTNILPHTAGISVASSEPGSTQYLDLLAFFMALKYANNLDIPVGASIPFWYDTPDRTDINWNGEIKHLHQHAQDITDYVTVLAFRDFAGPAAPSVEVANGDFYYRQLGDPFVTTTNTISIELSDDANGNVAAGWVVITWLETGRQIQIPSTTGTSAFAINAGQWTENDDANALINQRGVGNDLVRWTLVNAPPGTYTIGVTWPADPTHATDAPFTIYDGNTPVKTVRVNQQIASGGNGITSLAWAEVKYAQQIDKPAYVAVDTTRPTSHHFDSNNTFVEEGIDGLNQEFASIANAFASNTGFAGFAINDLANFPAITAGGIAPGAALAPNPPSNNDQVCFPTLGSSVNGQRCTNI